MTQLGFYLDMERCIGCKTCQIACKDVNDLEVGTLFRKVGHFETGQFPQTKAFNYSSSCNHCAEPQCVAVCPVGAMYKAEDGTVQHDDEACLGCQYCVMACPYGVPQYLEEKGITAKCSACASLREADEQPACVASCLMRCLDFGDLDELKQKYGTDTTADFSIMPDSSITTPSVAVRVKDAALSDDVRICLL